MRLTRSTDFESDYRAALHALASSGRAMEINTSGWLPLDASLLSWWRAEGGEAVSFGSDAHDPFSIGRGVCQRGSLGAGRGIRSRQRPIRFVGALLTGGGRATRAWAAAGERLQAYGMALSKPKLQRDCRWRSDYQYA